MAKTKSGKKPSKKTAKAPKIDAAVPATWPESKVKKPKARDPRLPPVGTTIVRPYKGTERRIKVLADGFELDGKETFKSLTALARSVTGYPAISGPAWAGLTKDEAAPAPEAAEKPAAPAKTRAPKAKRAGRDPQAAAMEAAPENAPAAEVATA